MSANDFITLKQASALLDTGSNVSTVSESFYRKHLSHHDLYSLTNVLKIECADGQSLPYLGYIHTSISAAVTGSQQAIQCLVLVCPDFEYSKSTPLLLGTNFLSEAMKLCEEK